MPKVHPAEQLRSEVWPTGRIPVDIDLILENMGVEIIPTANLRDQAHVEACISADLKSIHIDLEYYQKPAMAFRVRYSLAHELGHMLLHKHIFSDYRRTEPKTILEWAGYVQKAFDIPILEREANEFAGIFLVPEDELRRLYEEHYPQLCSEMREHGLDPGRVPRENIRSYLASRIHRYFEVSDQVVEIRLRKSGTHPNS